MLTSTQAEHFAGIALANVVREYPNKQDHVLGGDGDHLPSRLLHPAFYGSFDWHSCVHMHWLLVARAAAASPTCRGAMRSTRCSIVI